jgi:hypothetical protein
MPPRLSLICHPFHNGLEGVDTVETPAASDPEIVRVMEADRGLARRVPGRAAAGPAYGAALDELAFERLDVAAAITAYDPALGVDGRMARAAMRVVGTVTRAALGQRATA